MREFRYEHNELWCESVRVTDIAGRFGTPVYIYSKSSVVDHCRHIESAFGEVEHLSCYAVKANANKALLRIIAEEGIGAEVGSAGELKLALDAGFPPSKVTFSGVGKRDDEIEYGLNNRIHSFNVESEEELGVIDGIARRLKTRAPILLRVNFDVDPGTHPYITTGKSSNKFGVDARCAEAILQKAQTLAGIDVLGLHSHIGSQITRTTAFVEAAGRIKDLVGRLRTARCSVSDINIGGGFGVQYHDFVVHPSLPAEQESADRDVTTVSLLKAVLPVLEGTNCRILIEPGRSIVAHAGILVTRVLYRKENGSKTFVIVDAGMNDLIRPSLYQSYHQVVPLALHGVKQETVDVVGPLCESGDFFALDRKIPRVGRGDYLALLCAGAYGFALSSNYNSRLRPAEVLVQGSAAEIVRRRESLDDL